jgi:replicative DNA helicase
VILDPQTLGTARMFIHSPDYFFKEENRIIFRVLCELEDARTSIDAMILRSALITLNLLEVVGGIEYIVELANAVPTSAHAEAYAAIVAEKYKLRQLISACTATIRDAYEEVDVKGGAAAVVDKAMGRMFEVAASSVKNFPRRMSEVMPDYLESLSAAEQVASGLPTGYTGVDRLLNGGGLQNGELILIAARPSVGKTSFATGILESVCIDRNKPAAFFSLEMDARSIAQRLLSTRSAVDSKRLRKQELTAAERDRLASAAGESCCPNWWIDDTSSISFVELRTKALRLRQQHAIELLVVDYLGLMESIGENRNDNRNDEVGRLSRALKGLARELQIPVIVLSQLNRKCEDEQRSPRASDLRDSGNLEQDADVIILLHREAVYHRGDPMWAENNPERLHEAQVIIAKQRNGAVDVIQLQYFPWCTRFVNLEEPAAPAPLYEESTKGGA